MLLHQVQGGKTSAEQADSFFLLSFHFFSVFFLVLRMPAAKMLLSLLHSFNWYNQPLDYFLF